MRKLLLFVLAAVPFAASSPAVAGIDPSETEPRCPVPAVETGYDVDRFVVDVSLTASGCPAREHRIFEMAVRVIRMYNNWGRDVNEWTTTCGPFRSADDVQAGEATPSYSCDLSVMVPHPRVEHAQYDLEITYPGATAERTMTGVWFCTSDADTASCQG